MASDARRAARRKLAQEIKALEERKKTLSELSAPPVHDPAAPLTPIEIEEQKLVLESLKWLNIDIEEKESDLTGLKLERNGLQRSLFGSEERLRLPSKVIETPLNELDRLQAENQRLYALLTKSRESQIEAEEELRKKEEELNTISSRVYKNLIELKGKLDDRDQRIAELESKSGEGD